MHNITINNNQFIFPPNPYKMFTINIYYFQVLLFQHFIRTANTNEISCFSLIMPVLILSFVFLLFYFIINFIFEISLLSTT